MAQLLKEEKNNTQTPSHYYFAVKSENELYYQMASIFKYAADDEEFLAQKILFTSLEGRASGISPVN